MPFYLPASCLPLWFLSRCQLTQSPDCLLSTCRCVSPQAGYAGGHHVKQRVLFLLRRSFGRFSHGDNI